MNQKCRKSIKIKIKIKIKKRPMWMRKIRRAMKRRAVRMMSWIWKKNRMPCFRKQTNGNERVLFCDNNSCSSSRESNSRRRRCRCKAEKILKQRCKSLNDRDKTLRRSMTRIVRWHNKCMRVSWISIDSRGINMVCRDCKRRSKKTCANRKNGKNVVVSLLKRILWLRIKFRHTLQCLWIRRRKKCRTRRRRKGEEERIMRMQRTTTIMMATNND
mmetsp:Transcript_16743/g.25940  ORF Transcript_16743/g.25940 Transcript_16743/m.25940 type:complete len:215 (+) Transcript_16743:722-1366(+)